MDGAVAMPADATLRVRVQRFEWCHMPPRVALLYGPLGVLHIDDAAMRGVIDQLYGRQGGCLDAPTLASLLEPLGDRAARAFDFLVERAALLRPVAARYVAPTCVALYTDSPAALAPLIDATDLGVPIVTLDAPTDVARLTEPAVVAGFLARYDDAPFRAMYTHGAKRNTYLTSFLLERTLFIDAPYCPDDGQPCHYCQFGRLAALESQTATTSRGSWSELKRSLLDRAAPLPLALQPDAIDWGLIVFHLHRALRPLAGYYPQTITQDAFAMQTFVNVDDAHVHRDTVIHWDHCDCYAR